MRIERRAKQRKEKMYLWVLLLIAVPLQIQTNVTLMLANGCFMLAQLLAYYFILVWSVCSVTDYYFLARMISLVYSSFVVLMLGLSTAF